MKNKTSTINFHNCGMILKYNLKPLFYVLFFLTPFTTALSQESKDKSIINDQLNAWHRAAARADFDTYFSLMTSDAVFIGTDAEENWQHDDFMAFAKPYFDRGEAWNFKPLERNIYLEAGNKIAWFDELINTQMGICRGSGILKMQDNTWKIAHYVLSITVPNQDVDTLTKIKKLYEEKLIKKINTKN